MLLATALALLIGRMCSTDVFIAPQQTGAVAPKETITYHFFVSGIGQKKNCRWQPKFVAAVENVVKNRNPANIRKWIAFVLLL